MTFRKPVRMGKPRGDERPSSFLELGVDVEFEHDPTLSPEEMIHVNYQVARRIAASLHESNLFRGLPVRSPQSGYYPIGGRDERAPIYPLRLGGESYPDPTDLTNRIERACHRDGLGHIAYDHAGRAYELHASATYVRKEEMDHARGPGQVLDEALPEPSYYPGVGVTAEEIEAEALTLAQAMNEEGEEENSE